MGYRVTIKNRSCVACRPARAFTIVEMVVSIGVLGIMVILAGTIFTLTLRSSGQANALIEVKQAIRTFEQTLSEDLRYVQPGSSMMIIQGNRVNAYWTAEGREADGNSTPYDGYACLRDPERENPDGSGIMLPPRADVLMFFTDRPGTSLKDPVIKGRKQQVVYGHAELGELQADGSWFAAGGDPRPTVLSDTRYDPTDDPGDAEPIAGVNVAHRRPAREWHLARRSVLILDQRLATPPYYPAADLEDGDESSTEGSEDDPAYGELAQQYYILDGRRDYVLNRGGFNFDQEVRNVVASLPGRPQADVQATPLDDPTGDLIPWFARSQMDPDPPPTQVRRMGHYMLPNCASFKVEWLLDAEAVIGEPLERELCALVWIDPVDPIGSLEAIRALAEDPRDFDRELLLNGWIDDLEAEFDPTDIQSRFYPAVVGRNHIFYARVRDNGIAKPDPFFPKALRVTVDVYDRAGRLERPIRHVMILPIGQG